jgi:hypothetical protein
VGLGVGVGLGDESPLEAGFEVGLGAGVECPAGAGFGALLDVVAEREVAGAEGESAACCSVARGDAVGVGDALGDETDGVAVGSSAVGTGAATRFPPATESSEAVKVSTVAAATVVTTAAATTVPRRLIRTGGLLAGGGDGVGAPTSRAPV